MKKDLSFIKQVLNIFENSDEPYLNHSNILQELSNNGSLSAEQLLKKYYYHISLLYDLNCLECVSGFPQKKGFDFFDNNIEYTDIDIRLTNNGHTMIIALNDDVIWKRLLNIGHTIANEVLIDAGKKIAESGLNILTT